MDDESAERRDSRQFPGRSIGSVVSCTGSSAIVTSPIEVGVPPVNTWSIGNLVTIVTGQSRVIGFIRSVETEHRIWSKDRANTLIATIDLVGEITDTDRGPHFQRGIRCYPHLGDEAHRIRHDDLESIYRVGSGTAVEVGKLSQDSTISAAIDVESMLKRHFAIVGTTGVGKSTSVSIVVHKAVESRPDLRVIMLDPHNEFAAAFPGEARVLDTKTFELPFWMLRFEEFTEVVFRGREASEHEIDFLREAIENSKAAFLSDTRGGSAPVGSLLRRSFRDQPDTTTADRPTPFRLTDIYSQIEEEIGRLESRYPRYDLKTLRNRLKEVADDANFAFMFGKSSVDDSTEQVLGKLFNLPDLGTRVTILQMGGIPSDSVNGVVSVLARLSFDLAMLSSGSIETLLVCEEAHRYIPNDASLGFDPTRRAIARIAKEGRKYGAYLAIVTQRPGELDPTILSQCSTVFAMRLTNDFDQDIIRSAIADSSAGILAFLSSIGNREAIAFGEAIATPMRMKFVEIAANRRPIPAWSHSPTARSGVDLREIVSRMRGNDPSTPASQAIPLQDAMPQGGASSVRQYGAPGPLQQAGSLLRDRQDSRDWPAAGGGFRLR